MVGVFHHRHPTADDDLAHQVPPAVGAHQGRTLQHQDPRLIGWQVLQAERRPDVGHHHLRVRRQLPRRQPGADIHQGRRVGGHPQVQRRPARPPTVAGHDPFRLPAPGGQGMQARWRRRTLLRQGHAAFGQQLREVGGPRVGSRHHRIETGRGGQIRHHLGLGIAGQVGGGELRPTGAEIEHPARGERGRRRQQPNDVQAQASPPPAGRSRQHFTGASGHADAAWTPRATARARVSAASAPKRAMV